MDRDTAKKILTETFVREIISTEYNVIEEARIIRIANVKTYIRNKYSL